MALLYLLNLVAYPAVLMFSAIYFTRYFHLRALNPLIVILGASLPTTLFTSFLGPAVILADGLYNPYFQYALLVFNVHELLGVLTLIFLVRALCENRVLRRLTQRIANTGGWAVPSRMRTAAWLFLGLYLVFFVLLAQHSFSVVEWIKSPRTGYQLHRTGAGQWYALAITSLSVSLVLATLYARSSLAVVLLTPIYLALVYFLGSKGLVISFAVYVIIILAIQSYRYLTLVTAVVAGGAALLVIINFAATFGSFGLSDLAGYSDAFSNASLYYQRYLEGSLPLYHGRVFLSNFWGLLPRALYPNKPYVYGSTIVTDVFYPGAADQTNTPAFATVEYFADFGWLGVFLLAVLNPANLVTALLYSVLLPRLKLLNNLNGSKHSRVVTYLALLLIAPGFLLFFDFPNNLILFLVIAVTLDLVNRLRFLTSSSPAEMTSETQ